MASGLDQLKALLEQRATGVATLLDMGVESLEPGRVVFALLRCEGTTVHLGGRIATTEGRVTDDQGRLVAHGTSTCMVFRPA